MKKIAILIASGFGSGFAPIASGTWGALMGLLILWAVQFGLGSDVWIWPLFLTILFTIVGYWSIGVLPSTWSEDDSRITVDEIIGMLITMIGIPLELKCLILGFILFRIFDIVKPLGIRAFDKKKTNWAVIVDVIIAGVYANLLLRIFMRYL